MHQPTRSRLCILAARLFACASMALGLSNCSTPSKELRVSVRDQKMALYEQGQLVRTYGVSTSKFGLGDGRGTNCTPLGKMKVAKKIGDGLPPGMMFKSRRPTGEIVRPDSPGRDPIVTRILWLAGAESKNRNAYSRYIYIHGTPEERNIGQAASFGCIRMRSMDIIDLYSRIPVGASVKVERGGLPVEARSLPEYVYTPPVRPVAPGMDPNAPGDKAVVSTSAAPGDKAVASTPTAPVEKTVVKSPAAAPGNKAAVKSSRAPGKKSVASTSSSKPKAKAKTKAKTPPNGKTIVKR